MICSITFRYGVLVVIAVVFLGFAGEQVRDAVLIADRVVAVESTVPAAEPVVDTEGSYEET